MEHDSLPNFKKKKKKLTGIKSQMKNMSKEAIKSALLRKKKCNDRAIEIVNLLIEPRVPEGVLLSCLFDINQSHFDDIIEERAISKLCGYPLCGNPLRDVPMKQFHISTRTNKVYDITERKNFCSNLCYKAGTYLKDQLYSSPLWLREHEDPIAFKLLPFTVNIGSSGEEINFGTSRVSLNDAIGETSVDDTNVLEEDCKKSVLTTEQFAEQNVVEEMVCDTEANQTGLFEPSCDLLSKLEAMDLVDVDQKTEPEINIKETVHKEEPIKKPTISNAEHQMKVPTVKKAKVTKKSLTPKEIIMKIEHIMQSWFTFETFCFLLGEEKVRKELDSFGLKLQHQKSDPYLYDRYSDLCRKLNLLELEETYGTKDVESPKKPLPDFDKLKEEARQLEIKVKSFYKGSLEYEAEEEQIPSDEPLPILPPLDTLATKAARRRIFLQKLGVSLPDIQEALGLRVNNLSDYTKEFAATLNLTAQNICLKPTEWNIVAIVLIKLISLRDSNLKENLLSKKASNYLELILMSYTLDSGYLDRLVCWLLDINYLVNLDQT